MGLWGYEVMRLKGYEFNYKITLNKFNIVLGLLHMSQIRPKFAYIIKIKQ